MIACMCVRVFVCDLGESKKETGLGWREEDAAERRRGVATVASNLIQSINLIREQCTVQYRVQCQCLIIPTIRVVLTTYN